MNVYAEDGYTVNQLNEGGDTKTLHNSIDLVSEKDASSGNGSSAGNAYIYYLNVNGLVKGSVISSLHKENKYATFIEFDENGKEKIDMNIILLKLLKISMKMHIILFPKEKKKSS